MLFFFTALLINLLTIKVSGVSLSGDRFLPTGVLGFRARVVITATGPKVVFSNSNDGDDKVYCLTFVGVYEQCQSTSTTTTSDDDDDNTNLVKCVFPNSYISFATYSSTFNFERLSDTSFRLYSTGLPRHDLWELIFTFNRIRATNSSSDDDNDTFGLKFTININGYQFLSTSTQYAIEINMDNCANEFSISNSASASGTSNSNSGSDSTSADNTDADRRRRLTVIGDSEAYRVLGKFKFNLKNRKFMRRLISVSQRSNSTSTSSDEGVSSDDRNEYDFDSAVFVNNPTATAICSTGNRTLTSTLFNSGGTSNSNDGDNKNIILLFDNFATCNFTQDPKVFVDKSKMIKKKEEDTTGNTDATYNIYTGLVGFLILIQTVLIYSDLL